MEGYFMFSLYILSIYPAEVRLLESELTFQPQKLFSGLHQLKIEDNIKSL